GSLGKVQRHPVAGADRDKMRPLGSGLQSEDVREKFGRSPLILGRNDGVVEFDSHPIPPRPSKAFGLPKMVPSAGRGKQCGEDCPRPSTAQALSAMLEPTSLWAATPTR